MSIVDVSSHDVQVTKSSFITCATGLTLASHVEPQFVHDILKCYTGYSPLISIFGNIYSVRCFWQGLQFES